MIRIKGRPPKTARDVVEAALEKPQFVEIGTTPGIGRQYTGSLDALPEGGVYYARQGNVLVGVGSTGGQLTFMS